MIAIVVSRADRASEHIGEHLLDLADWEEHGDDARPDADGGGTYYRTAGFELRTFDELHIYAADPVPAFEADPDLLLFVSRHSGDTGPLLTAHFTGNFGPAEYGGEPGRFARACPNALAALVDAFEDYAPGRYEVGVECTHHGPSEVEVPSMFVELGSAEPEWEDPEGARAVARAVLDLRGTSPDRERQLVGFGGGHYAPRFHRILRETPWAVGHVGSDWQLEAMGDPSERRDVIRRAFEASDAAHAVIDGDYPELEATIEDLGYRVASETWVREVGERPLDLVDRLEADLATVDEGLRFGDRVPDDGAFAVVPLPDELLAEAQGVDADAARGAVEANAVAFETEQGGTRAVGRAAVAEPADRDALVDDLAAVLERKYDAVDREDGVVIARETAFDPAAARELGVPEGPAFGRLAAGESVEVDGAVVEPESVRRERTRKFPA
ncbi:D-aminoacyl-tRNA deacylase [Halegenticoccus soli]|uniref:D-aminoacyl-tRNA deacylase n=1 Tax=Halegenticoccus soli TaxID=1985678 RepID=UPI000C6C9F08|nr:D-aminoacyl-tRNA deacylase [Halegenticoccus soli]